jgi:uncharacterized cupin superfamily protein
LNLYEPQLDADGVQDVDGAIGGKQIGATLYELAPGGRPVPYHWHVVEEEWLLVVQGTPTLRTPAGERVLQEGDVVVFPVGPEGAHTWRNDSDAPVRVLMWANLLNIEASVYPDSSKVGLWTEHEGIRLRNRVENNLDYWDGEPNA